MSDAPGDAVPKLLDGSIDLTWGGPMRVMQTYHNVPGCDLVCFGEVVTRDPFLLVGPIATPRIAGMADLAAMTLGTVSEVPTPWMCLQQDLRDAGIDPAKVERISGRAMTRSSP